MAPRKGQGMASTVVQAAACHQISAAACPCHSQDRSSAEAGRAQEDALLHSRFSHHLKGSPWLIVTEQEIQSIPQIRAWGPAIPSTPVLEALA